MISNDINSNILDLFRQSQPEQCTLDNNNHYDDEFDSFIANPSPVPGSIPSTEVAAKILQLLDDSNRDGNNTKTFYCCCTISTRLVDSILCACSINSISRSVEPRTKVLSIGPGSGLLEWLVQQRSDVLFSTNNNNNSTSRLPRVEFLGVEVSRKLNIFLPESQMQWIQQKDVTPDHLDEDINILFMCYLRNTDILKAYLERFGHQLRRLIIVGPISECPLRLDPELASDMGPKYGFREVYCNTLGGDGLVHYEQMKVFDKEEV